MRRCISSPRKILSFSSVTSNLNRCRKHSVLAQKVAVEQTKPTPPPPPPPSLHTETLIQPRPDPYRILASELSLLRGRLVSLLGAAHPGLRDIAQAYFQPSKQLRPLLVLLFSRATNGLGSDWERKAWGAEREVASGQATELDRPLILSDVLHEWNPNMPDHTASFDSVFELRVPLAPPIPHAPRNIPLHATLPFILPTQVRLAQIVEMIHIASVLHDTISDSASEIQTHLVPNGSGNKLSILGGDFLLGRASAALSRLGDDKVVELIASVISNLVEGEILQMADSPTLGATSGPATLEESWDAYLRHVYLKTASLLAKSARSGAILGGCIDGDIWQEMAYAYGRNLGMAHQLAEDASVCDSPASLKVGLARGPVLYACEEHPEMQALIQRGFSHKGDLDLAFDYVHRSSGIERTRYLALKYADKARHHLLALPDSDTKVALDVLASRISQHLSKV